MIRKLTLLILISNAITGCVPSIPVADPSSTQSSHERSQRKMHEQATHIQKGIESSLPKQSKSFRSSSPYDESPIW